MTAGFTAPRWRRTVVFPLLVFLPLLMTVVGTADVVKLRASANLTEHDDLTVQVLVARAAENQRLVVTADSAGYFASSETTLDGEYSPRVTVIRFRGLSAGFYEVTGSVFDQQGKMKGSARQSLLVFPR